MEKNMEHDWDYRVYRVYIKGILEATCAENIRGNIQGFVRLCRHMAVSQNIGTPRKTPQILCQFDPQNGTPNFGKPLTLNPS